jgi:6-phosphogluconolactonase (cycloisomerase 2 family)
MEKLPMSGLPSWTKVDGKCLFVTVTDSHYVLSYAIGADGKLSMKSNATLAPAMNPVFIDKVGDFIVVANYHGPDDGTKDDGTAGVGSLRVSADCSLTAASFLPAHGHSVNPGRQGMSHIHSTNTLPGSKTQFITCDLGADAMISMKIDSAGKMTETARLNATQGAGPRHMAFHPNAPIAYTLFEMGSFVGAYKISPTDGSLTETQRITTLPKRKVFSSSPPLSLSSFSTSFLPPPSLSLLLSPERSSLATPRPLKSCSHPTTSSSSSQTVATAPTVAASQSSLSTQVARWASLVS